MTDETTDIRTPLAEWLDRYSVNKSALADACGRSRAWLHAAIRAAHVDSETRAAILSGLKQMRVTASESDLFEVSE